MRGMGSHGCPNPHFMRFGEIGDFRKTSHCHLVHFHFKIKRSCCFQQSEASPIGQSGANLFKNYLV